MGTVIAYDVLTGEDDAPDVDALVTLGQPARARPTCNGASRPPGPGATAGRRSDWERDRGRMSPTGWTRCAASTRRSGRDFCRGGVARVLDVSVTNEGRWRHSIGKYLRQQPVRQRSCSTHCDDRGGRTAAGRREWYDWHARWPSWWSRYVRLPALLAGDRAATRRKSVLHLLRASDATATSRRVADALLGLGLDDATIKRQFAQSLVDRENPAAARCCLPGHPDDPDSPSANGSRLSGASDAATSSCTCRHGPARSRGTCS